MSIKKNNKLKIGTYICFMKEKKINNKEAITANHGICDNRIGCPHCSDSVKCELHKWICICGAIFSEERTYKRHIQQFR